MNCTQEGRTAAQPKAAHGRDITAGRKASEATRRLVYGRQKVGGLWAYAETTGSTNQHLHLVLVLADGPISEVETVYIGKEALTYDGSGNGTGKWAGRARVIAHLGEPDQEADSLLVSESAGKWTANHRLRGVAYLNIRLTNWDSALSDPSPDAFASGTPDISAVIKGCGDIFDPRTGSTGYSDNPALCLAHYRQRMKVAELSASSVASAATACDALTSYGKRYTVAGVIEASVSVEDATLQFLAACSGKIQVNAGVHSLIVGTQTDALQATERITYSDLRAGFTLTRNPGDTTTVSASYSGEDTGWKYTDADGDSEANRTLKLEMVPDAGQAAQVQQETNATLGPHEEMELTLGISHLDIIAGDVVDVELPPHAEGRFEVIASGLSWGIDPRVKVKVRRMRLGIYDPATAATRTAETLDVSPRTVSAPSASPGQGAYPAANYPLSISLATSDGATLRWSTAGQPQTVKDGNPYYGAVSMSPGVLYISAFKNGWTSWKGTATFTAI
jgi:hypothetical protein